MTRIVLVHPAPKIWTRAALVPLGLAYIAAYLEKNGFDDIQVVDYNVEPKARLPKADIVGITATTPLIKSAWKIAKRAKQMGAITVIGGPHVSALPEESARLPQVDFVCIGEGEETLLELCRTVEKKKKDFTKIKGLCFKKGRKLILTRPRPFITNLDILPFPAYHFFKLPLYTSTQPLISTRKPAMGILTSRGCPFGCNFCYKGTFGRTWRARGVENVLTEWEYLVKELGVAEIALMDDGFNLDIERAIKICQEIKKRDLAIPWRAHNGIRADRAPKRLLRAMRNSGCYIISFGVESGVQRVLDLMGKDLQLKEVIKTFKNCRDLGILIMAFFMIGNPGETREEIKKTINFSLELDPDFAQFSVTTPFPGTPIFDLLHGLQGDFSRRSSRRKSGVVQPRTKSKTSFRKKGKIKITDWDKYSQFDQKGYFDYGELKAEEVAQLASQAYRRFYLRPKTIFRLIKRKETWLNTPNVVAGGAHYLLQRDI